MLEGETHEINLAGQDTQDAVHCYERDFYVFSNFSAFQIIWKGLLFPTSEHLYHWEKFDGVAQPIADLIRESPSAHEAFKIAERQRDLRRKVWDIDCTAPRFFFDAGNVNAVQSALVPPNGKVWRVKDVVMLNILRAKTHQHEYVRHKLHQVGGRMIVEDSWRDTEWGSGPNHDGLNVLGKLWRIVCWEEADRFAHDGTP